MAAGGVSSALRATFVQLWRWLRAAEHRRCSIVLSLLVLGNISYAMFRAVYLSSCDLVHGYLIPARGIFVQNKDPYIDFTFNSFSPFFYVAITPLALLPHWVASLLWSLLSLGALIGVVGLTRAIAEQTLAPTRPIRAWLGPLLAGTLITDNLYLGQSNLFALFLVCCAVCALLAGHDLRAGIWLSAAIAWKLTPALFLFYFALQRRLRTLLGAALGLVLWLWVAPSLAFGPLRNRKFLEEWLAMIVEPFARGARVLSTNVNWYHTNQSLEAFLHRHFTRYGRETYGGLHRLIDPAFLLDRGADRAALVIKLLILATVAWAALRSRRAIGRSFPFEISLTLMATLFISPVSWYSHYVAVLVPYQVALQELATRPSAAAGFKLLAIPLGIAALATTISLSTTLRSYSLVFLAQFSFFCALAVYTLRFARPRCGSMKGAPPQAGDGESR